MSTTAPTAATPASPSATSQLSLAELAADPSILMRLTQSWGELRAEVSALRAELRLRTESGDAARLEDRVRRLERDRSPLRAVSTSAREFRFQFQSNAAAHRHPLQHLIVGDGDEGADVVEARVGEHHVVAGSSGSGGENALSPPSKKLRVGG
ncbi:hypothetical protein B0H12DRAFT_1114422 [Mycena haematopus]|nr:hypothetical protein B0H12DRAFT_1114422 [Mycena haematopus]